MATYNYWGVSKKGRDIKGTKESVSKQTLTAELRSEGIFVSKIEEAGEKKGRSSAILELFARQVNLSDTFFQLALLLKSGIQLVEGLKIIAKTTANPKIKNALLESASKVSEGMRFSDTLMKYKTIFEPMYVNLIRASEQVGKLANVLTDIAIYEEDKRKNADKLTSAMIYPMTILVIGMGVIAFLLAFVVPKMESIFKSMKQEIPASTQMLLSMSEFVTKYGIVLLGVGLFIVFTFRYLYRNHTKFRLAIDKQLYKSPIIANLSVAKFSHVLAFQLKEGLPLTDAIYYASLTIDNMYMRNVLLDIRVAVQSGTKLSIAVKNANIFPELFPAAVSTGESSGNMPELLERVNEFYSKQVDKVVSSFVSIIEPLFIVFIGLLVGFIVVSIMEPLFKVNELVG